MLENHKYIYATLNLLNTGNKFWYRASFFGEGLLRNYVLHMSLLLLISDVHVCWDLKTLKTAIEKAYDTLDISVGGYSISDCI